ncbi:hypothetical protein FRC04_007139 [Tulasnella sp. 424]|nr:hypothetical protein FRC04_007139 [Tulasnella sp. 424]KAG8959965.1 hypothetical protein FRC05_007145 [Tulasnella sp. 425]
MPPHSMQRETGTGHHRSGTETIHQRGWRGLMNSTVLSAEKGKPGRKSKQAGTRVRHMDLASCQEDWLSTRRRLLKAYNQETEEVILAIEGEANDAIEDGFWQDIELAAYGPVGDPNHGGNDYPNIMADLQQRAVLLSGCRNWPIKYKTISRRERLERVQAEWSRQLDVLTDTYLKWKHGLERIDPLEEDIAEGWEATTLSMSHYCPDQLFPSVDEDPFVNVTLIKRGFLGSVPTYPTTLFSLETLEDYRLERLQCGRWSFLHKAKVLCQKHNIPYRPLFRDQLQEAFYAYLSNLENVKHRVKVALNRNEKGWFNEMHALVVHMSLLQLEGEEPLKYRMLVAIDGNNSVKRDITSGQADTRTFDASDFYINRPSVNIFHDEVNRTKAERKQADGLKACTDNWKANAPDAEKKAWDAFDETGFFISACRHQIVLTICDMVRSGELSKYWLATVHRLIDLYGGQLGIGYDIGCTAEGTARRSELLKEKFVASQSRFAVPAFHGWAHGRLCQLQTHIRSSEGFGLEDVETCERIFSALNGIASALRHSSKFTRHRFIAAHFENWNQEMQERLATFAMGLGHCLLTKYKAAVATLSAEKRVIEEYKAAHHLSNATIEGWIEDERKYLKELQAEPEYDVNAIHYVQLLDKLSEIDQKIEQIDHMWIISTPTNPNIQVQGSSGTAKLETSRRNAFEQRQSLLEEIKRVEVRMGIVRRWTNSDDEYQAASAHVKIRDYRKALDRVELLIVQRLFELEKLNLSGTGYKLRKHIGNALRARSQAIRTALAAYNNLACKMSPPRPTLDWDAVVEYSYLSQFELLRDCRQDIRTKPWAVPAARLITQSYLKVRRAEEEVCRLNIEARRLYTWLKDEYWRLKECRDHAEPLIAKEIDLLINRHVEMGGVQQHRLAQIAALPGFSGGELDGGRRRGSAEGSFTSAPFLGDAEDASHREAELRPRLPEEDELVADEIGRFDDYVHEIE